MVELLLLVLVDIFEGGKKLSVAGNKQRRSTTKNRATTSLKEGKAAK